MKFIILIIIIFCVSNIFSQTIAKYDISLAEFRELNSEYVSTGYHVISIIGYELNNTETYSVIWTFNKNNITTDVDVGLNDDELQLAFFNNKDNYIITFLTSYVIGTEQNYAYIAQAISSNFKYYDSQVFYDMSYYQLQQKLEYYSSVNYRLKFINSYVVEGDEQYVAIFDNKTVTNWDYGIRMTESQYRSKSDSLTSQGYKLLAISGYNYTDDGSSVSRDAYAAVWVKEDLPTQISNYGLSHELYGYYFENLNYQGFSPIYINVFPSGESVKYNSIWSGIQMLQADINRFDNLINSYMSSQKLIGLSFAITKNERLVYAKSYGYSDNSTGEPLVPTRAMRTIGVSKIYTGLAILKLIELGKLQSINCKVFETGGLLDNHFLIPAIYESKFKCISTRLLLTHASGLNTCKNEPVFFNATATQNDVTNAFMELPYLFAYDAGKVSFYSNIGYNFLGRVVEKLSGTSYEQFVKTNILNPLNITSTFVGNADGTSKRPLETNYYPKYVINMQLRDSFGGWVATPIDMVRLAVSMDGSAIKKDILNSTSIGLITSAAINSYGLGVKLGPNSTFGQVGCDKSSQSILWKYKNNITYSITINSDPTTDVCSSYLKPNFENAIDLVTSWPSYDLF